MGKRIDRTLKNWRWWAVLPVFALSLPVIALDLALAALVTAGEVADGLRVRMRGLLSPLTGFVRKGWPA